MAKPHNLNSDHKQPHVRPQDVQHLKVVRSEGEKPLRGKRKVVGNGGDDKEAT